MLPDLHNPTHVTRPLAELAATLEAYGVFHLLEEQLAKPALGHPMFAAGRRLCRVRWLESELAVARQSLGIAA